MTQECNTKLRHATQIVLLIHHRGALYAFNSHMFKRKSLWSQDRTDWGTPAGQGEAVCRELLERAYPSLSLVVQKLDHFYVNTGRRHFFTYNLFVRPFLTELPEDCKPPVWKREHAAVRPFVRHPDYVELKKVIPMQYRSALQVA